MPEYKIVRIQWSNLAQGGGGIADVTSEKYSISFLLVGFIIVGIVSGSVCPLSYLYYGRIGGLEEITKLR